ncbi:MAG: Na(+)/H(+) antiporter subunit D [SAR202 cluster bacterium]|nr:Na(+)/H(+) antiporter subunit D [SAR202 cluster bacterium]
MPSFPPALIMLAGAVAVAVVPRFWRHWAMLAFVAATLAYLFLGLEIGDELHVQWLGFDMAVLRVDKLSLVFGSVFVIIALIGTFFSWHMSIRGRQVAAMIYAATALGVVFAGDLLTLVVFWEAQAVASYYLIAAGGMERSLQAGTRYLFVHLVGGSALLAGVLWHYGDTGSLQFVLFDTGHASAWLILLGFAVNAAIPPFHAWLPDAYPEAGVTGTVFLSAVTTKTAVYVLARGFAGWELLMFAGVAMALYGIVYAMLENDMRRLLSYHIVSQVGFMVTAIGIGGPDGINGASAHAFAHVLYKGLLIMGVGAVMQATGRRKMTDLGGILHRMRWVFALYMIAGFSISAVPLFSGFTTKSLVIYAAEHEHIDWVVFALYLASVGTFLSTTLKLPYGTWGGPRRDDVPVGRVPPGMYVGMVAAAVLCVGIGVYPQPLYAALPHEVTYDPYTPSHTVNSLQLLAFTFVGFMVFIRWMRPHHGITLDTDWLYRRAAAPVRVLVQQPLEWAFGASERVARRIVGTIGRAATSPEQALGGNEAVALAERPWLGVAIGAVVVTVAVVTALAQLR